MSTKEEGTVSIETLQHVMEIINNLTSDQREKLEQIWLESKKHQPHYWVDCKDIRLLFENDDEAVSFINSIGGLFVTDEGQVETGGSAYKLTLWGMLASPSLTALIEPVVRVIEHVRSCTKQKVFPVVISDTEFCEIAQAGFDALEDLRQLFLRCDALRSLIYFNSGNWNISKNDSVTRSRNFDSATACLCKILEGEYQPWMLVHAADRQKREWESVVLDKRKLLKLIIRYLSVEDVIYARIKRNVTIIVILIAVILPGMISGIVGLLLDNYVIALGGYIVFGFLIGLLGWMIDIVKEKRKLMESYFVDKLYKSKMKKLVVRFISKSDSSLKMVEETREDLEGYKGLWSWRLEMLTSNSLRFYVSDLANPHHRDLTDEEIEEGNYWEIS